MSRFGNLVREHIPPYYPSWLAVPLKLKDTVWETICEKYVLPQEAKRKLMKSANTMWRNGNKILRKKYEECDIDDERKKNCPKKTEPEDWVRFVNLTSTKEVKASRERNKINRSKMLTPHATGTKGEFRVADEMMEVDPTITWPDSFLIGHTRSDGPFPTTFVEEKVITVKNIITKNPQSKYLDIDHDLLAQVFGPVKKGCVNFMGPDVTKKFIQSTELLKAHITEDKESYIDLKNHFSQYKAENDARFENLKDMVASLRSSGCTTTSTERSGISTPLLREEAVVHFLNFHEHIVAIGRALVLPGLQESDEAEYEVIVDIIFEENSPVFGQCGVFFDERLIGTKIKYLRILMRFAS
ncbi:hypothetical protein GIB67_029691 [Kingdonia uniflora]|uniref:Uncharacterized protein n=1 Tax=Kingdonia uniflora TaxID=39325 RepID=A0A7J7LLU6_9MAGN|nr:hypothetical protein GIB67_029691 [Kingdonia uniflora]